VDRRSRIDSFFDFDRTWNASEVSLAKDRVRFIEPRLALAVSKHPEGAAWSYELKFDGIAPAGWTNYGMKRAAFRSSRMPSSGPIRSYSRLVPAKAGSASSE